MHYAKWTHFTFSPSRLRWTWVTLTRVYETEGQATILSSLKAQASKGLPDFSLRTRALYWKQRNRVSCLDADVERIAARTLPIKRIQRTSLENNICLNVWWCIKKISMLKAPRSRHRRNYRNYWNLCTRDFLSNFSGIYGILDNWEINSFSVSHCDRTISVKLSVFHALLMYMKRTILLRY